MVFHGPCLGSRDDTFHPSDGVYVKCKNKKFLWYLAWCDLAACFETDHSHSAFNLVFLPFQAILLLYISCAFVYYVLELLCIAGADIYYVGLKRNYLSVSLHHFQFFWTCLQQLKSAFIIMVKRSFISLNANLIECVLFLAGISISPIINIGCYDTINGSA